MARSGVTPTKPKESTASGTHTTRTDAAAGIHTTASQRRFSVDFACHWGSVLEGHRTPSWDSLLFDPISRPDRLSINSQRWAHRNNEMTKRGCFGWRRIPAFTHSIFFNTNYTKLHEYSYSTTNNSLPTLIFTILLKLIFDILMNATMNTITFTDANANANCNIYKCSPLILSPLF